MSYCSWVTKILFMATLPEFPNADQLITIVKKFTGGSFSILTSPLRGDHEVSSKYKTTGAYHF